MIPFYGCQREYEKYKWSYIQEIDRVLATGQVLQGPDVEQFENALADQCDRKYAVAVGSCTDALFFAMRALDICKGDEVLVTDFSFQASATAIYRTGATPLFVDIDDNYQMDLKEAEKKVSRKTIAILLVHMFGDMQDPEKVMAFANKHHLEIVEDAAQALGSSYDTTTSDIVAGSIGRVSCMSFDPTKVVGAPGSGGAVLTDSIYHAGAVRELRYKAMEGYNSQMPSLTAALLRRKLHLDYHSWRDQRGAIARIYLDGIDSRKYVLPITSIKVIHNWHKFVIRTLDRDELQKYLAVMGVETKVHYKEPLHQYFREDEREGEFHNSNLFSTQVLSLPIHPFVTKDEAWEVVKALNEFF